VSSSAAQALANMKAVREGGGKAMDACKIEDEEAVYDVVSDEEYSKIAAKRRQAAGNHSRSLTVALTVLTHTYGRLLQALV
jgi:hypothetical protein